MFMHSMCRIFVFVSVILPVYALCYIYLRFWDFIIDVLFYYQFISLNY
jgi:hypothetical protein